jgi:hypothetical protein
MNQWKRKQRRMVQSKGYFKQIGPDTFLSPKALREIKKTLEAMINEQSKK